MKSSEDKEAAGCALVIAIACIGFGIGFLCGPAWGFLSVGCIFLLMVFMS